MATQAKHRPTFLPAPFRSGTGPKARRAASRPRRHPPRCSEPWKEPRRHQVRFHGSMPQSLKPSKLGLDRSRLQAFGEGIGSPWHTGARKRLLLLQRRLQRPVTRGYIWYRFGFPLKFIWLGTQIHFDSHPNSFVFLHKWILALFKMGWRCLNCGIPTKMF